MVVVVVVVVVVGFARILVLYRYSVIIGIGLPCLARGLAGIRSTVPVPSGPFVTSGFVT